MKRSIRALAVTASVAIFAAATLWAQNADVSALLNDSLARQIAKQLIKQSELVLTDDKKDVMDGSNTVKWGNVEQWYAVYDAALGPKSSFAKDGYEKQQVVRQQVLAYLKTPANVQKVYQNVKPALADEIRAAGKGEVVAAFLSRVQRAAKLQADKKLPADLKQAVDQTEMATDLKKCEIPQPIDKVCPKWMWDDVQKHKANYVAARAAMEAANAQAGVPLQAIDFSAAAWLERRRTQGGDAAVKAWLDVATDMMVTLNPALKPAAPPPAPAAKKAPAKKDAAKK